MNVGNFILLVASAEHSLDRLIHRVLEERPTFENGHPLLSNEKLANAMPVSWQDKSKLFLDWVDVLEGIQADLDWLSDFQRADFESISANVYNCRNFLAHGDSRAIIGSPTHLLFTEKYKFKARNIGPEKVKFKSDFFHNFTINAEYMRAIYISFGDAIFGEEHMISQIDEVGVQYVYD